MGGNTYQQTTSGTSLTDTQAWQATFPSYISDGVNGGESIYSFFGGANQPTTTAPAPAPVEQFQSLPETTYAPPPSNPGGCTSLAPSYYNEYLGLQEQLLDEKIAQEKDNIHRDADEAAAENRREAELRQAQADAEQEERRRRMKKGKRDIIYNDYTGYGALEADDDNPFLLLGDN